MSEPVFRGALAEAPVIESSITITARDDRGMIDLRGDVGDRKFAATTKKVLGLGLPTKPRHSTGKTQITALWLSPDQWLITCPRDQTAKIADKLQTGLTGLHSLAVDVSDARSIIRFEGEGARMVVMKGAPVDLTLPEITDGYVRRVRFAELAALVHVVSIKPEIVELYVFRSYAQYAWDWLCATSSEQSKLRVFCDQPVAAV